ncbi:MAG TPA: asparagine synthase (glutamine-hydrolyzing) [Bacteroidota bacterium]|nr:asparagine synthase (glutamine-hydrolyzing) [Bacteroidota bacterium]
MCGIAGYIRGGTPTPGLLEQMCDLMIHRGPDDAGYYHDDSIALGMRRLSIIDPAGGHQPVYDERRTLVAILNGEIYNHIELKRDYCGSHTFSSNSDTEVLVHLYEEMGIDFIHKLNGMYAFALWDISKGVLYVVRDRLGIKPLYYFNHGGRLIFASEIKPILIHDIPEDIDYSAVYDFLNLMYIRSPRTMFKHIRKLEPGCYLEYQRGMCQVKRYWRLTPAIRRNVTEGQVEEELDAIFQDSIRLQLRSDVPIGTFLSGGIDSGAVVAYESQVSQHTVSTFSVGFENGLVNELPYAREVAAMYGTKHHELLITGTDLTRCLPKLVEMMEEPHGDSALLPTYLLSEFASGYVKVILNGTGGDELFGGYDKYITQQDRIAVVRWLKLLPDGLVNLMPRSHRLGRTALRLVQSVKSHSEFYYHRSVKFDSFEKENLLSAYDATRDVTRDDLSEYFELQDFDWKNEHKNAYMLADIYTYLQDDLLLLLDKMAMAHSLEGRVPFLDHRIVEFSQTIPASMKIRGREKKYLMKRWLAGRLPGTVLSRPKAGFGAPISNWYDKDLSSYARDVLLDDGAWVKEFLSTQYLESALDDRPSVRLNAQQLFMLMCLELWSKAFLRREKRTPHDLAI